MASSVCCICDKPTDENNILLNGDRYHQSCYEDLKEGNTEFDWKIEDLRDRIKNNRQEIRQILSTRSLLQKLFGSTPSRVETLSQKNEEMQVGLKRLLDRKEKVNDEQQQQLADIYDYWPERPPDWYARSRIKRNNANGCEKCGKSAYRSNDLHVHHKVPISKGGDHSYSNLEVLCAACHQKEHHHSLGGYSKSGNPNFKGKLNAVEKAHRENLYLSFKYRRYSGGRDEHFVEVKHIFNKRNATYFRGYCILNNAERDFRVDKIFRAEIKTNKPSNKLPSEYIEEAMKKEKILHFHYTKSNGDKSVRSLDPIGYTNFKGVQVFEGFDYLTDENRCFAPHRMSNIELVDEPREGKVITGTA